MNDDIFYGTTDGIGPDTDPLMHTLLKADPVPAVSGDFWQQLDDEMDQTATTQGRFGRGRSGGGWKLTPFLVAALLIGLAALGGAYQWIRAGEQRVTMDTGIVDQPDASLVAPPAPTTPAQPTPNEPTVSEPTLSEPTPSEPTPNSTPAPELAGATEPSLPLADGTWRIAPGSAVGVSPDGEAAWVNTLSPVGGSGCEGTPERAIWRVPFDGTTPTLASDADLSDIFGVFTNGDRAAMVDGCDGYSSSVVLATIQPGGYLADTRVITTGEGLDGIARLHHIEWQDDGSLLLLTTDGVSLATGVYERDGDLRSRNITAGTVEYTVGDGRTEALEAGGWQIESRDGFVHAKPTDGGYFFGTPIAVTSVPTGPELPLLIKDDFSGWFSSIKLGPDPCVGDLLFTSFRTGIATSVVRAVQAPINQLTADGDRLTSSGFCEETFTQDHPLAVIDEAIASAPTDVPDGFSPSSARADVPGPAPSLVADRWEANERFAFHVAAPLGDWQEQLPRSTNGDGFTFTNGPSVIRVFGTYDVDGQVASAPYANEQDFPLLDPDAGAIDPETKGTLRSYTTTSSTIPGGTFVQHAVFTVDRVVVIQGDLDSADTAYVDAMVSALVVEVLN